MSIANFNVGTDFSEKQLEFYINLNEHYDKAKIKSVFGSLKTNVINLKSARPDYRIGNTDLNTFKKYVKVADDNGIEVEYAANAPLCESVADFHRNKTYITDYLKYLENVGVKRIIASNPLLMEIIYANTKLKIKASTILGINNPNSIKYYSAYGVDSICIDIYSNRNLPLIADMKKEADKYNVSIELLVNEICFYGDVPCSNMLRTSC